MEAHDRLLRAFLAGDVAPADARRWDEHLLECEQCWRAVREDRTGHQAVQMLRRPVPPGLADRVAFAVEVAAAGPAVQQRKTTAGRWSWRLASAGVLAIAVAVTLLLVILPGRHESAKMPASVAVVARYARAVLPLPGEQHRRQGGRPVPAEIGRPVTVTVGGGRIVLRTWQLGSAEVVVAVSRRPFPMPAGAAAASGAGMAWSAQLGRVGLYCVNGRISELVAGPVPAAQLPALAARLPVA